MPKRPVGTIDEGDFKDLLDKLVNSWSGLEEPVARIRKILDEHPTMAGPEWPQVRQQLLKALEGLQTVVRGRCVPPTVYPGVCAGVGLSVTPGQRAPARKPGSK